MRTRRKGRWLLKQLRLGARSAKGTFFIMFCARRRVSSETGGCRFEKKCDKIYSLSIKGDGGGEKEILLKLRQETGMNRRICEYFGIPYRTVQEWELGHREMPGYLL